MNALADVAACLGSHVKPFLRCESSVRCSRLAIACCQTAIFCFLSIMVLPILASMSNPSHSCPSCLHCRHAIACSQTASASWYV